MKLREFNFNSIKPDNPYHCVNLCVKEIGATVLEKERCFEELTIGETLKALPLDWAEREIVDTRWFFNTFVIEVEAKNGENS